MKFAILFLSTTLLAAEPRAILPQRLSGPDQGLNYVCSVAKKQGRPLALVLRKSHACDNAGEDGSRQCMLFTQAISDNCLKAVRDRFALFHIRLASYPKFTEGEYTVIADQREAWNAWDAELAKAGIESTPGLILVDVLKCRVVSQTFLYDVDFRGNRMDRINAIVSTLAKEAATVTNPIVPGGKLEAELAACVKGQPEIGQLEIWQLMNGQDKPRP